MRRNNESPIGVEFRRLQEVEGMLELSAPESLYLLLTNELTPSGEGVKNVIIASNLPKAIASKMAMV